MKYFLLLSLVATLGCTARKSSKPNVNSENSLAKLEELIAVSPSYENYISLGLELSKVNRGTEAVAAYRKAIEINPQAPIAWNNMCAEFNNLQRYADAIANCKKAIELEPKFQLARNNLELANTRIVELKKVVSEKKKSLLANPSPASQELIDLGMDLFNISELNSSIEIWSKVGQNDPLYATAQNNIASSYILLKKFGSAETAIGKALKIDPSNVLFANNKKWLEEQRAQQK